MAGWGEAMTNDGSGDVTRVLVANRGEIAVRIIRACHALGIEAVAVYSDADAQAPHVALADRAERLGPEPAHESYLDIDRVLAAAARSGADAVHPGYGFLSENADFVDRCVAAGLTFIGPSADAMRALGDKARAKAVALDADVPTVPEWAPDAVPADAYPVLVKAAAGGGGRGMRRVDAAADLPAALDSARREAHAGFGDDTLLVERLVEGARHVEVQLLADAHGTRLYVGDRDCSLQRRHQKVVEEAPAPGLSDETRRAMGEATVRLAAAANYVNAGTAEFLVAPDGSFYFLELNARLQVEHPVSEEAFGIDLAAWQLRIARGERLDVRQQDLVARGCAIEARVYAEDPVSFLPTGGDLLLVELPDAAGVRVDHALRTGARVSLAYDPLLAKVIATGPTREAARAALLQALRDTTLLGTTTNVALLQHALRLPDFVAATHDTATLERFPLTMEELDPSDAIVRAARRHAARMSGTQAPGAFGALGRWRTSEPDASSLDVSDELQSRIRTVVRGDRLWAGYDGQTWELARDAVASEAAAGAGTAVDGAQTLVAPMPGTVIAVLAPGTDVELGDAVVVLEAMKMENAVSAPVRGRVESVRCAVGDLVARGAVLAEVAP